MAETNKVAKCFTPRGKFTKERKRIHAYLLNIDRAKAL
jgi:hypothetical protein